MACTAEVNAALGADSLNARPPLNRITKALNLRATDACGQAEIKYHLPAQRKPGRHRTTLRFLVKLLNRVQRVELSSLLSPRPLLVSTT